MTNSRIPAERRYRPRGTKIRAAAALSRVGRGAKIAVAIERSEQLVSELRNGKRNGPIGRLIRIIWDLEAAGLDTSPIEREIRLACRESKAQHSPDVLADQLRAALLLERDQVDHQERLGRMQLLLREITLEEWREQCFWPLLENALKLDAITEHLIGEGMDTAW